MRAGLVPRGKTPGLRHRREGVRRRYQGRPLTVARATPRLIDGGDLLAALIARWRGRCVISAQAGSGKTSLLRAWADRPGQRHRLAVMQVRRDQQDAQHFGDQVLGDRALAPEELHGNRAVRRGHARGGADEPGDRRSVPGACRRRTPPVGGGRPGAGDRPALPRSQVPRAARIRVEDPPVRHDPATVPRGPAVT